jgi:hypothetical protein
MKKKTITFGVMLFASISVFGQKQETVMPRFNSDAEKAEWIMTHPDDYERMTGEKVSSVLPEFKTQAEKDAFIKSLSANPSVPEFKTQAEKDAYFTQGKKVEEVKIDFTNEADKDAWLKANPEKTVVTQEEFNALPADKQAAMLSDKNYVIIK